MATLLHHIQSWMQKSIAEFEARVENRMEDMMDRKVQTVNNHLDAFKPSPRNTFTASVALTRDRVDDTLRCPI
ncbi:hypothetical protein H5410_032090 [Solanum commersonii]|uniref:Uncharacterized protein n=1 Tax=Solanum commersonii TaxID=4109 RepID=A0A9J5YLZ4_SOLCO|nr:hypothetical protein H5410_032090 [Solanum commersonii]